MKLKSILCAAICSIAMANGALANDLLTVGDLAKPLKITHWLKGKEVTKLEPGKVYVLEFWATWCGPCIANMEHLSEAQEKYQDRNVKVIGLSDEPLQKTVKFLLGKYGKAQKPQNERIRYALATDPDRSVHKDYFDAAGLRGIPSVFIIGKDARIEWIGHPTDMDPVLEAVVEDRWDRNKLKDEIKAEQESQKALKDASKRLTNAREDERWEDMIVELEGLIALGHDGYIPTKLAIILSKVKDRKRGYVYANELIKRAWDDNHWLLAQVAYAVTHGISTGGGKDKYIVDENMRDYELGVTTLTRANEITNWESYSYLASLAKVEFKSKRLNQAVEHQAMAVKQLTALEPKIQVHELDGFREHIAKYQAQLEQYKLSIK
ncbi:MAG: TlpA family protein disulfide reductase [Planctomycetes bacterium]|nr:TlpA family protein disulfide reductase [Planctomycetota bacterium]